MACAAAAAAAAGGRRPRCCCCPPPFNRPPVGRAAAHPQRAARAAQGRQALRVQAARLARAARRHHPDNVPAARAADGPGDGSVDRCALRASTARRRRPRAARPSRAPFATTHPRLLSLTRPRHQSSCLIRPLSSFVERIDRRSASCVRSCALISSRLVSPSSDRPHDGGSCSRRTWARPTRRRS